MSSTRISASPRMAAEMPHASATLQFEDNTLLARLVGDHDKHLRCLEEGLEVEVARRGNRISIQGVPEQTARTRAVLSVCTKNWQQAKTWISAA